MIVTQALTRRMPSLDTRAPGLSYLCYRPHGQKINSPTACIRSTCPLEPPLFAHYSPSEAEPVRTSKGVFNNQQRERASVFHLSLVRVWLGFILYKIFYLGVLWSAILEL